MHYYSKAEAGAGGSWWISVPDRDGIVAAADDARQIVARAQEERGRRDAATRHGQAAVSRMPVFLRRIEPEAVLLCPDCAAAGTGRCCTTMAEPPHPKIAPEQGG